MERISLLFPPDSSPVYIFAMPKIYKRAARRVRGKEILGRESGGECEELRQGDIWAFLRVTMGWWRKSVLHVGREEILWRQGCSEFEVLRRRQV